MEFGANTFIWQSPFSTDDLSVVDKVGSMGFDVLEIACEAPERIEAPLLGRHLAERGLRAVICGVFGPDRDLSSEDEALRENARRYLRWCVEAAHEIGAEIVCGPMYATVGKARVVPPSQRAVERQRSAEALHDLGEEAAGLGVKLALEPLNRFETDMLNTVAQGLELLEQIDSDHVGLHLDTFHMHLEEKSSADAIRAAGGKLFHVHACENDRGVPGTGQVDWTGVASALREVGYEGSVVIESFTPDVASIAQAVCIWRKIAPDQDAIAHDGLAFLQTLLD